MSARPSDGGGGAVDVSAWMGVGEDEGEGEKGPRPPERPASGPVGAAALRRLFATKSPILVTSDLHRHERIKTSGKHVAPPGADAPLGQMVPQIWPTLAGQPINNRGNTISVDSTKILTGETRSLPVIQVLSKGADAQQLMVMLGFTFPFAVPTNLAPKTAVQADVRWGTGNVQFQATIDWLNGTVLCLPATFLSVSAIVPGNSAVVNPAKPAMPFFVLGTAIAYGTAPPNHPNRVKFTTPTIAVPAVGPSTAVDVPAFANAVGLTVLDLVPALPAPITLQFLDLVGAQTGIYVYTSIDNLANQGSGIFPIPNGSAKVQLLSAAAQNVRLLFDLAL